MKSPRSRNTTFSRDHTREELTRYTIAKLQEIGVKPRRRLGQSFVVDPGLVGRLIELSAPSPDDVVLEIGAGLGTLTRALAMRCKKVYAVEIDGRLCSTLSELLNGSRNVEILCGDALKIEFPDFDKIVSNPPFSISSRLILRILGFNYQSATMTFQDEFASRIIATPGSRDYGRLTVSTQLRAQVLAHEVYPASSFFPEPETNARILELRRLGPQIDRGLQDELNSLLLHVFSQRRRKMARVLETYTRGIGKSVGEEVLRSIGEKRVFQLAPQEFLEIATALGRHA